MVPDTEPFDKALFGVAVAVPADDVKMVYDWLKTAIDAEEIFTIDPTVRTKVVVFVDIVAMFDITEIELI